MNRLFSRNAIILIIACAVVLFALSVLLKAYDNKPRSAGSPADPGSYSVSALGYEGFYDTLRRLKRPVMRSAGNPLGMTGNNGTLIVAEPDTVRISTSETIKLLTAPRLLLVLPKWSGRPDEARPLWIDKATPVSINHAQQTMRLLLGPESVVFRADWPQAWATNLTGITPTGRDIVQLIQSDKLKPIVGNANGMLVGEMEERGRVIWVLADPDIMANHGITKGDNAAFMTALVDILRHRNNNDSDAPIVFDETVHGYYLPKASPLGLIFRFPFVVVTWIICCTAVLLVWSGARRFGAPLVVKPPLDFGKAGLINNGARLLDYAGYQGVVIKRYVRMVIRTTGQALHAPGGLSETDLAVWLDRIGKARGVEASCAEILRNVNRLYDNDKYSLTRLFQSAWDIHRWKGEILNESGTDRGYRKNG